MIRRKMKQIIALLLIACTVLECMMPISAVAASGFKVRNSAPSTDNKYYYSSKYNANVSIDGAAGWGKKYNMPNCTTYVLGRVYEITGSKFQISGNAGEYFSNNKASGKYSYSTDPYEPQLGAVVCFDTFNTKTGTKMAGHVQVVEKIGSDSKGKYICVSESNYSARDNWDGEGAKAKKGHEFNYLKIYLKDLDSISEGRGTLYFTSLEDNDGYKNSEEVGIKHNCYVGMKFQGYIYTMETMELSKNSLTLEFGEISVIKVTSDIPEGETVTWKSSNTSVAVVTSSKNGIGTITGAGAGTAVITAMCGTSMVATCEVKVESENGETYTLTNTGTSGITQTSARINAKISPGVVVEEAGFFFGTSKSNMTKKKESVNCYTETVWYDLGTGKWWNKLSPGTKYYYQLYVVINGTTYKTEISSFTTANAESFSLNNTAVTNLSTTSATINAKLSPGKTIEKAGFYFGTSSSNLTKKTENVGKYTETVWYDLGTGKWCGALTPNTKYYYRFFVVIDGVEYKSSLTSFTTPANKIITGSSKFSSQKAEDITETSAKIGVFYPEDIYDDVGFYFGKTNDLATMKKTSEYKYGGSPSTSYYNSYKLGVKYDGYGYKWWEPLETGTRYYYAFYIVKDGIEYVSGMKYFITKGTKSVTNVSVDAYPTKREYTVGEKIDTTGLKLSVSYSNGSTTTITSGFTVMGNTNTIGGKQVTVTYEGYSFKYNITVINPLKSISLSEDSIALDINDVKTLAVVYNPTDTSDSKAVTWSSSDEGVATVVGGMITAVGEGNCVITATCGNVKATCEVVVENRVPLQIYFQPETQVINEGEDAYFTIIAKGEEITYQWQYSCDGIEWLNSNLDGNKTDTLKVSVTEQKNGHLYRCLVEDKYNNLLISDVAKLETENPFKDVAEGQYYYEPVLWAYNNGITSGLNETEFAPDKSCTRGQIVTFLWRAAGKPQSSITSNPFKDVSPNAYYTEAILWAYENGITSGLTTTEFGPEETCTRAQIVTFLWRAFGKQEPTITTNPFVDIQSEAYYYKAVLWAVENGITAGTSATTFGPEDSCTRGQVVSFLYRAYN